MNNPITMKLNADELILQALREDITSEDITTNAVMPKPCEGQVDLICKQDGILAGSMFFAVCLNCWMRTHRQKLLQKTAIR